MQRSQRLVTSFCLIHVGADRHLDVKMPATVTDFRVHRRALPGIVYLIITCIGPKLALNLRTTATAHVTLYRTWRPSDLSTGLHVQVLPRGETRWNLLGVPQTPERIWALRGSKFTILWGHVEEVLLFKKFFPIVYRTRSSTCHWCAVVHFYYFFVEFSFNFWWSWMTVVCHYFIRRILKSEVLYQQQILNIDSQDKFSILLGHFCNSML